MTKLSAKQLKSKNNKDQLVQLIIKETNQSLHAQKHIIKLENKLLKSEATLSATNDSVDRLGSKVGDFVDKKLNIFWLITNASAIISFIKEVVSLFKIKFPKKKEA